MTQKAIVIGVVSVLVALGFIFVIKKNRIQSFPKVGSSVNNGSSKIVEGGYSSGDQKTSDVAPEMVKEQSQIALSVTYPLSGTTVTTPKILIKGKTVPKAEIFANEAEGIADISGNFSVSVALDEGENSIILTVVDSNGNVSEKELLITYDAGQ